MKITESGYVNHEYVNQLTCSLFALQQKQILCDVTLTTDDGKLLAHSAVLAAVSDFICGQFEQLTDSGTEFSVLLPGCDLVTLKDVLTLLYTGNVHLQDPAELGRVMDVCTSLGVSLHNLHNVSITVEAQSSVTHLTYVSLYITTSSSSHRCKNP